MITVYDPVLKFVECYGPSKYDGLELLTKSELICLVKFCAIDLEVHAERFPHLYYENLNRIFFERAFYRDLYRPRS